MKVKLFSEMKAISAGGRIPTCTFFDKAVRRAGLRPVLTDRAMPYILQALLSTNTAISFCYD